MKKYDEARYIDIKKLIMELDFLVIDESSLLSAKLYDDLEFIFRWGIKNFKLKV